MDTRLAQHAAEEADRLGERCAELEEALAWCLRRGAVVQAQHGATVLVCRKGSRLFAPPAFPVWIDPSSELGAPGDEAGLPVAVAEAAAALVEEWIDEV